jgi:hypothetical protein
LNALTATETARIKAAQLGCMFDTCQIGTTTEAAGSVYSSTTISYATAIPCGFSAGGGRETNDGGQAVLNDGTLRVPQGTAITSTSYIKLISRCGYTLGTPEIYRVLGGPQPGPFGLIVQLQRVPTGGTG